MLHLKERNKQTGRRCLGKQRDGNYALSVGVATGCFTLTNYTNWQLFLS
jgi:hypothetical protein